MFEYRMRWIVDSFRLMWRMAVCFGVMFVSVLGGGGGVRCFLMPVVFLMELWERSTLFNCGLVASQRRVLDSTRHFAGWTEVIGGLGAGARLVGGHR